jgi:nitrogen fixation protein NifB
MTVTTCKNEVLRSNHDILLERHPCFNEKARHTYARIHLPVAPRCNVQCKFCDRKYSCVNESRPGVTAMVMTPTQALEHLKRSIEKVPHISVVGIAGPGDPFANPRQTIETLRLVRKNFPDLMLCVSTNGLNVLPYVDELKKLKVSHVTITVNAVDPLIGEQIYEWMRYNKQVHKGPKAAFVLWDNQQLAIQALSFRGILVKINTVCIPGINAQHVEEISRTVVKLGASLHNVIPLLPTANTAFASIAEPTAEEMEQIRLSAQRYLPQMKHCSRCRSDAIGHLGQKNVIVNERPLEFYAHVENLNQPGTETLPENKSRPYIAIASRDGVFVDIRKVPPTTPGCRNSHWLTLAEILKDCYVLLVSGIGPVPKSILSTQGIKIKIIENTIQDALSQFSEVRNNNEGKTFRCGETCNGTKNNCSH